MASTPQPVRYEVDLAGYRLLQDGRALHLERQPMELLFLLVERRGELVTREDIAARLWGDGVFVDADQSINRAIRKLRVAFRDDPEQPQFLETVVGKGYRFIGSVAVTGAAPPAKAAAAEDVHAVSTAPPRRRRFGERFALAAGSILLIALGATAFRARYRSWPFFANPPIHKVVVLPFENLSGDAAQEYLADGFTDELTTELAQHSTLQVISRTSAMRFKGMRKPLPEIARSLGVDAVVEGTVVRQGDRVRVTAQLIQASNDTHLWAETYQDRSNDIVRLQAQIAADIATSVQSKLIDKGVPQRHEPPPSAHEAYLKGLYFWNKLTERDMKEAIGYFRQAIDLDPAYAEAYASLGSCYGILGNLTAIPPNESFPLNKAAALKALEIDDTVSEAHAQLAFATMFYDHDWLRAEKEFRRALELNPSNANAHRGLAQYFVSNARFEDALAEIERARELDPVSLGINFDKGWFLHFARRPDEAMAQFRRTLEMDANFTPAHVGLGNAYELKADYDGAIAEYQTAIAISGEVTSRVGSLGYAYAMAGRRNEARRTLKRLKESSRHGYVSPYHTALIYVGLGEKDEAFTWLEKAYSDHYWMTAFLKVDARLDPLRSDPRFQDILRRVGLDQ